MYLDFNDPVSLKGQINTIQPTRGICIFIDICGSTEIKRKELKKWILLIGNTIRLSSNISPLFRDNILKLIGDEIMIFIPDEKINSSNENYATVFDFLKTCLSSNGKILDNMILKTKAAIHYCKEVYNISYYKNLPEDYYGNDIDLTARLMQKSSEGKIIISENLYQLIKSIDKSFLIKTSCIKSKRFKGIKKRVKYRITTVN